MTKINKVGKPKSLIDWDIVDSYLEAGCSGRETASAIGISEFTLYDRCVTDNSMPFSQYIQLKSAKGEALLRKVQYDKARGISDQGDNTLLIWLGKCRLKQSETIQSSSEVKVTTVDYSKCEPDNDSPQVSTQEISTSCSQSS